MSLSERADQQMKPCRLALATAFAALALPSVSHAFEIPTAVPDLRIRWDNTAKYSALIRLRDQSSDLIADINADDGNRNFDKGMVSNRLDLLSEFDLRYRDFGLRLSGAAWYDGVYFDRTDNNSPDTVNSISVGANRFTKATRKLHGRKAEMLDAFVFWRFSPGGESSLVTRVGSHSVVYGETLFFGSNGIAAAQGVTDTIKALSVPNSLFKEIQIPVNQISADLQINDNWAVGGYYQLEWERQRLLAAGSYFSSTDMLDDGGERLWADPSGAAFFLRGRDIDAKDSGQAGFYVKYRPDKVPVDYGFYAARYHSKGPQLYLNPGIMADPSIGKIGEYRLVFPEDIKTVGVSVGTVLRGANVAAELSFRSDMPLISSPGLDPELVGDNSDNPLYAIGRTAHLNLSLTNAFGKKRFWDNAQLTFEAGGNRVLSITENRARFNAATTRDAWGFRVLFEPNYYQVMPGLDLAVPMGLGWNPKGKTGVVAGFNGGAHEGGDLNIGLKGVYLGLTRISLTYSAFIGTTRTANNPFGNVLSDRDYASFTIQRTF